MTDLDDLLARADVWLDGVGDELVEDLAAAVRVLRDRPCPHIETGDDGTAFCTLAEAANTAWAARADRLEDLLRQANEAFDECTGDYPKELVANDPWRAVPDRPGGTDNPTSDEPVCRTCANSGWVGSRSDPKDCPTCGRKPYFLNGGTYPAPAPAGGNDDG